jgi:hypothetical protein
MSVLHDTAAAHTAAAIPFDKCDTKNAQGFSRTGDEYLFTSADRVQFIIGHLVDFVVLFSHVSLPFEGGDRPLMQVRRRDLEQRSKAFIRRVI